MHEIIKYGLIGIINTLVGYGGFLIAFNWANFSPQIANIMAYIAGLSTAFILNKIFVFKQGEFSYVLAARFLIAFAFAFGFNQIIFIFLIYRNSIQVEIAQIFAMIAYTVLFYTLNKYIVYVPKK